MEYMCIWVLGLIPERKCMDSSSLVMFGSLARTYYQEEEALHGSNHIPVEQQCAGGREEGGRRGQRAGAEGWSGT